MPKKPGDSIRFKIAMMLAKILAPILPRSSINWVGKVVATFFSYEDCMRIGRVVIDEMVSRNVAQWRNMLEKEIWLCDSFFSRYNLSGEERAKLERIRSTLKTAIDSLAERRESEMYDLHATKMAIEELADWFAGRSGQDTAE